jgi:signal transduction histidine kinase
MLTFPILGQADAPRVVDGLIDLSDWNFNRDGRVILSGNYEFYWQQHLSSKDFLLLDRSKIQYQYVPSPWNGALVDGEALSGVGYATYRVNVLVSTRQPLALKIPDFGTAVRVYIDGEELFSAGEAGASKETTEPAYRTGVTQFTPRGNRVEVIFQVSNFDHRQGGAWLPVLIGTPEQLLTIREDALARDFILFGATLIIGLYNIVLFAMRRENRSGLYLGLFCLLLATRQLLVGDRFATHLLEMLPYAVYVKFEYLGWYLAGNAFVAFMNSVFPKEFHRYATYGLHGLFGLGALIVLLAPVMISSQTVPLFQVVTIMALGYGLTGLLLATLRKREGALILLLAYGLLFGAIVSDILVNAGILTNIVILDMGLFVFVLLQSVLVSYRFTQSFKTIEQQRSQLEATNLKLRTQEKLRRDAESESEVLHQRIVQSEKMEAIGLLAGGVAHDLNNILSTTVTYPELALMDIDENSPLARPLRLTRSAGLRAAAVIQDMLTLTRRGVVSREVLNLNDVVREYLGSVEYQMMQASSPKVILTTDLSPDLENIEGSPVHLQKLLMNLVTNSIEAQGNEGRIYITTDNQKTAARDLFYQKLPAGDYVVLSIEDEGSGIDPDDLDKLFEPFYTTKVIGQSGTGLGMSVVWGVVYDHNGAIDVVSEQSTGTRFDVYLPKTNAPMPEVKKRKSIDDLIGDGQLILVVDDIEEQRELTEAVLVRLGYKVLTCATGQAAVALVENQKVDAVLIDMVMDTGWDGLQTFEELARTQPGIKSILVSGFAETEQVLKAQKLGAGPFQRKPFTIESLGQKIMDTLKS